MISETAQLIMAIGPLCLLLWAHINSIKQTRELWDTIDNSWEIIQRLQQENKEWRDYDRKHTKVSDFYLTASKTPGAIVPIPDDHTWIKPFEDDSTLGLVVPWNEKEYEEWKEHCSKPEVLADAKAEKAASDEAFFKEDLEKRLKRHEEKLRKEQELKATDTKDWNQYYAENALSAADSD